jgi:hypothetical protein
MRIRTSLVCVATILSIILTGCSSTVTINPTAVAAANTAAATVTAPAQVATAISAVATDAPRVATALANVTPPPVTVSPITPLPPEVAAAVITTYAKSQLGIDVSIIQAVGGVGELQLPPTAQAGVQEALKLAGTSYGAVLQGGLAVVALGRGEGSGDYDAQIKWASLGAFTLRSTDPYPADQATALALVKKTFPRLADVTFTSQAAEKGYAFYVVTTTSATDPSNGSTQTVGKTILTGVIQSDLGGLVLVYAIVGNGALATPLEPKP